MRTFCCVIFVGCEPKEWDHAARRPVDSAGFQQFVNQYARKVQAIVYSIFGDRGIAEEISVRVFAHAYRTLRPNREPWLDLVRLTIAESRRFRWASFVLGWIGLRKQCSDSEHAPNGETERAIHLLCRLPWDKRTLLVLREVAQLSPEQIATVLDSTPARVKSDLLNARRAALKGSKG